MSTMIDLILTLDYSIMNL